MIYLKMVLIMWSIKFILSLNAPNIKLSIQWKMGSVDYYPNINKETIFTKQYKNKKDKIKKWKQ